MIQKIVIWLILLMLWLVHTADAQLSRKVIIADSISHKSLPFATIRFVNRNAGMYADENGVLKLSYDAIDTMVVSHVGYVERGISGKQVMVDTFFLAPLQQALSEVIIKPYKAIGKEMKTGTLDQRTAFKTGSMVAVEFAVMIELPKQYAEYKLKKVIIPLQKTTVVNPVRLHLYEVLDDGTPGEELLREDVLIGSVSGSKDYVIDVEKQHIFISSSALYVSVEWVGNAMDRSRISGPFTRFTDALGRSMTYTRTINDKAHNWVKFNPGSGSSGRPPNLMAGLVVLPITR